MLTRRHLVASIPFALAALAAPSRAATESGLKRVAAIDWAAAEALVALGAIPVAVSDTQYFRQRMPVSLPETVADIGPFWEINLERLAAIAPDAILANSSSLVMTPAIADVAPVAQVPDRAAKGQRFELAVAIMRHAADTAGVPGSDVDAFQQRIETRLSLMRQGLGRADRPMLVLLPDQNGRRAMVYGEGSLPDAVLRKLGLANAWSGPVNANGLAQVGLDALMPLAGATFVQVEIPTLKLRTARSLGRSALWQRLEPIRAQRSITIPQFHPFGGLPSAAHFAEMLVPALERLPA
ncbi:ABC transporter substrate-binding protein [Ensifer sp.]|jgi:iron complex transport system substrate-binding protein|uniref:ABC transporter substrate-binding protein n=1 Tax=Ensifer sp. TaxID=1872086 RepID=UPI002E0F497B|nr:ABC transporter substrate-binding protein [Ensifer sp.]